MDRLTSMAVFVKAADLGSFTAAAAALGLSSQMVGKHVGFLEERLGAQLLRRTTRRQSLTAIGETFYQRCRAILADTEAAEALAHDLATTPRGRLRVNAPVTFGAVELTGLVGRYLRTYPDVDVELTLMDRFVDLVDEGYDVVVRLGPLRDSALVTRALKPLRLVACASPAYIEARGAPVTPTDLASHDCFGFVFSSGAPFSQWQFSKDGRTESVPVRGRFSANDSRVLRQAAIDDHGILLQADFLLRDDLASGRLVEVLGSYEGQIRPLHLLYAPGRQQTPKVRTFIDMVVEAFG